MKNNVKESIEIHDSLNPKLFNKSKKLRPEIKERIEDIVDEFISTLSADVYIEIIDIQILGSNASYNYTSTSDLDVHIIINSEDYSDTDLLMAYCNSKKSIFKDKYNIKIKQIPVELYVEDLHSGAVSNGIYSVCNDRWVKAPKKILIKELDVSNEVKTLSQKIHTLLNECSDVVELKKMLGEIYMMRKNSIACDGEFGKGNYIFKGLRDEGLIDALKNKIIEERSKQLTLESVCKDCFRL